MKAEQYTRTTIDLDGWPIQIETYRVAGVYHTTISSVDPGARFARADGSTREEAEAFALEKARRYLAQTRRFSIR